MARKPAAGKTGTAVANLDEELAALAAQATEQEATGGGAAGRFFSLRAGVLSYEDTPLPGNQMAAIILDHIFETTYYEGAFDPDNRQPPTAFAFGRDQKTMVWNEEYSDPEYAGKLCSESDVCQWGSAAQGKGKAAKEIRRLAVIPAGTYKPLGRSGGFELELIDDEDHFASAEMAFLKVPVMSVKGFSGYVNQIAEQFNKPLFAMYTRVYLTPDAKSQFRVNFELIEPVDPALLPVLMKRHKDAAAVIDFPYLPFTEEDEKAAPKKAAPNKKLTGRRK